MPLVEHPQHLPVTEAGSSNHNDRGQGAARHVKEGGGEESDDHPNKQCRHNIGPKRRVGTSFVADCGPGQANLSRDGAGETSSHVGQTHGHKFVGGRQSVPCFHSKLLGPRKRGDEDTRCNGHRGGEQGGPPGLVQEPCGGAEMRQPRRTLPDVRGAVLHRDRGCEDHPVDCDDQLLELCDSLQEWVGCRRLLGPLQEDEEAKHEN
mmetsp:Transcript_37701/g.82501  ORF Transcript_37701/g.82501 Transcript_37701/m.82501 type:complete len:206 (+) Transcript_37701:888-1505(+)